MIHLQVWFDNGGAWIGMDARRLGRPDTPDLKYNICATGRGYNQWKFEEPKPF